MGSPDGLSSVLVEAVIDAFGDAPVERARQRWEKTSAKPWHAWLLAALVRQVRQQVWMVGVIEKHGLSRLNPAGEIPGLPGHRFRFHGMGCYFHFPSGEILDVDFWADGGLTITPYFFARRLWSLARPEMIEARVRTLLPSTELCMLATSRSNRPHACSFRSPGLNASKDSRRTPSLDRSRSWLSSTHRNTPSG